MREILAQMCIRDRLLGAFTLGAVLITAVLTLPGLHLLFKVESLNLTQLGQVYLYAVISLLLIQALKWIRMKLKKNGENNGSK